MTPEEYNDMIQRYERHRETKRRLNVMEKVCTGVPTDVLEAIVARGGLKQLLLDLEVLTDDRDPAEMTREEVQDRLEHRGIDLTAAQERIKAALAKSREKPS